MPVISPLVDKTSKRPMFTGVDYPCGNPLVVMFAAGGANVLATQLLEVVARTTPK
jgi:hypothetical protein